jgi:hypothetical protein
MKKVFFLILSFLMSLNMIYSQPSDLEIIQSLISKTHYSIRMELGSLGLQFIQKKQKTDNDDIRYVFFIEGTENNSKTWEIFTKPAMNDKVLITRILIKYYYKNNGDLTELDKFLVPEDYLINGCYVSMFKSEGNKQAHIDIRLSQFNFQNEIIKQTKFVKVENDSNDILYIQLVRNKVKSFDNHNKLKDINIDILNIMNMNEDSCLSVSRNFFKIYLENNDSIILNMDGASYYSNTIIMSSYYISKNNYQKLRSIPITSINYQQDNSAYYINLIDPDIMIKALGVFELTNFGIFNYK